VLNPNEIRAQFAEEGHDPRIADIQIKRLDEGGWYGIVTPSGWDQIIIDLDAKLNELAPDYKIRQVKQKFGCLRYYIDTYNEEIMDAIDEAGRQSLKTCEDCGEPGKHRKLSGFWQATLCDAHYEAEEAMRQGQTQ